MRKLTLIILIIYMGTFLGACNKNEDAPKKNTVNIFYIDTKTKGLVSEDYSLISTDTYEQIDELLYTMKIAPEKNSLIYKSVLPDKITYTYILNTDGSLTIDFDSTYYELEGVSEILCRAALVKTLTQVKGVEIIQINVNGTPLIDSNNNVVGNLTAEDFIDNTETNTNYRIKLYFANKAGNALIEYDTEVNYTGDTSLEELAIEQLINGPKESGMYRTIPEGTVLLNKTTSDGLCTVDFNEKFLEKLPDVNEDIAIYSVVNTLVELPGINKVQFKIANKVTETFWEGTDFDGIFERNLELIATTK